MTTRYTTLGGRGDDGQPKLPFQTLYDDLHVEQSQEAAAETEAQGGGGLRLEEKGRVIDLQLFQGVLDPFILFRFRGIDAAVNHGLHLLVARQRLISRVLVQGDGVAYPGILDLLDGGADISYLSGPQELGRHVARRHDAHPP